MGVVSYPAPVGGWNARDDLASMPPEDAVILRNWRPRPGFLQARGGTINLASSPSGSFDKVGTATTFRSTFGDVLIFTGGNYIYGWDGTGAVSEVVTGTTKSGATFWDSAHFQDKFIMTLGDGARKAQVISYDGSTISSADLNITTGPNEEDIRGVQVHKGRAYYWEAASQSFWYAAAGAFQGDLAEFPLGTAIKAGGALQMMLTLTVDGGGGVDDLACFVFSSGEVLVYQGDDPGDAASWELVGVFQIGQPVDPQAHERIAGTELVFTRDGVIDLTAALRLGRFGDSAEFSNKITNAVTEAAKEYIGNEGWQIVHSPGDNCVLLNIPTGDGDYKQYVRETDTGGWWECIGLGGRFTVFQDRLCMIFYNPFAGLLPYTCFNLGEGLIVDGHKLDSIGMIETVAMPAFSAMRRPHHRKRLTAIKPFTNVSEMGEPTSEAIFEGRADFDVSVPSLSGVAGPDGPAEGRSAPNISVSANGHFLTFVMRFNFRYSNVVKWNSTTLFYEDGGPV